MSQVATIFIGNRKDNQVLLSITGLDSYMFPKQ